MSLLTSLFCQMTLSLTNTALRLHLRAAFPVPAASAGGPFLIDRCRLWSVFTLIFC